VPNCSPWQSGRALPCACTARAKEGLPELSVGSTAAPLPHTLRSVPLSTTLGQQAVSSWLSWLPNSLCLPVHSADARCSQLGAVHAARMRSLPNQQQLLLYALSVLCPKAEGGAVPDPTHSTTHPPDGLWGKPSWVPPAKRSRTGAVLADASCTRPAAGKGGPVALCSGIVSLSDAHAQYMRVSRAGRHPSPPTTPRTCLCAGYVGHGLVG
jgi:hypothetical protein